MWPQEQLRVAFRAAARDNIPTVRYDTNPVPAATYDPQSTYQVRPTTPKRMGRLVSANYSMWRYFALVTVAFSLLSLYYLHTSQSDLQVRGEHCVDSVLCFLPD